MVSPVRGPGPGTSIFFREACNKVLHADHVNFEPRRNPHQFPATRQNLLRDTLPCMDGFTERNSVPNLT
jgi:hypothetical protein